MAIQQAVYSRAQRDEAARLVAMADKWAEGYDRKTGVRFVSFTSRRAPHAIYYTRIDGKPGACTCPGARKSRTGRCFHQLACAIMTDRVQEQAAKPSRPRYEDLWTDDVLGLSEVF